MDTWIDDNKFVGANEQVEKMKSEWGSIFDCDDEGPMVEYIGCKMDIDKEAGTLHMTQPVIIQSFSDE